MVTQTFMAFILKILAACSGFLLNVVLARLLGPDGTGLFYLALSCGSIAIMVSQFGLGQTLLRFVAISSSKEDWVSVKGVIFVSIRLCTITALIVSGFVFILSPFLSTYVFKNISLEILIKWITLAVVPGALFVLFGFGLQGLRKIKESIFITSISMPLLTALIMLFLVPQFGVLGGVWSYVISSWTTLFLSFSLWKKFTPQLLDIEGFFNVSTLLKSNIPLFWVSLSQLSMAWSSSIMLGMWGSESDVGLFSVANKTAILVSLVLSCVNTVVAPKFAALYQEDNIYELQEIVSKAMILMMVVAAPIAIIMILFPRVIMSFFGSQFVEGANILTILVVGQFVYVVTGAVGFLLTMSGHEKIMKNIMIICSFLIVILNIIFIPRFGALGAAIATSITLIFQNTFIAIVVWRIIGVIGIPFGNKIISRRS